MATAFQQQPTQLGVVPDFAFPFPEPDDLDYAFGSEQEDDNETSMFAAISEESEMSPPHDPAADAITQKKRRRTANQNNQNQHADELRQGSPASSDGTGEDKGKPGSLRLTDAIDKLAAEQEVLKFDSVSQLYVVLDGPAFESRFDELRCTRAKRSDGTNSRPFSRMHNHYVLVRGEKWAKTGSAFRAKDAVHELPRGDQMQASKINITLVPSDEVEGFQVTLQHFLNVTCAGDLFKSARQEQEQRAMGQHGHLMGGDMMGQNQHAHQMNGGYQQQQQQPMAMQPMYPVQQFASHQHYTGSVTGAMHSMWNQNSRGDQAYFFFREEGVGKFKNGSVVMLREGKILPDATPDQGSIFMVVSDDNAKWKGEPLPTREEEQEGHWCCFLGQVPVWVEGKVKSGEYLGPKCDGSGEACVRQLGDGWPVVGMALASKDEDAPGIVRTMAFAGLNAMSSSVGAQITPLFEQAVATRAEVSELREDLQRTKAVADRNTVQLKERLNKMEEKLMSDKLTSEDREYLERKRQEAAAHQLFMRNLALVMMILAVVVTMAVVFFLVGWFGFWGGAKQERVVVYNTTAAEPEDTGPILACQDMGTYSSCTARRGGGCEWVNFGDAGSFCLDSSIFAMTEDQLPECDGLTRDACDNPELTHEMCKYTVTEGRPACVENVVAHEWQCRKKTVQSDCENDMACEWLDEERGGAWCVVARSLSGLCSGLRNEVACDKASACTWNKLDIVQGECVEEGLSEMAGVAPGADQERSAEEYEQIELDCMGHLNKDDCVNDPSLICVWSVSLQSEVCEINPDAHTPPSDDGDNDKEGTIGGGVNQTAGDQTTEVLLKDGNDRSIVAIVLPAIFGAVALGVLAALAMMYNKRKKMRDEAAAEMDKMEKMEQGESRRGEGEGEGGGEQRALEEGEGREHAKALGGEVSAEGLEEGARVLLASDAGGPAPMGPSGV